MEVFLRRVGARTAVVLPQTVLKALGIKAGQSMILKVTTDRAITLSPKCRFSLTALADMLAQCDPKAAPTADLALWDVARPAGQEVW